VDSRIRLLGTPSDLHARMVTIRGRAGCAWCSARSPPRGSSGTTTTSPVSVGCAPPSPVRPLVTVSRRPGSNSRNLPSFRAKLPCALRPARQLWQHTRPSCRAASQTEPGAPRAASPARPATMQRAVLTSRARPCPEGPPTRAARSCAPPLSALRWRLFLPTRHSCRAAQAVASAHCASWHASLGTQCQV